MARTHAASQYDRATPANVGALSPEETAAWESRIGFQTDNVDAWGKVVSDYLFAQAPDRRVPHLTHALRVYPYVPQTPEGTFSDGDAWDAEEFQIELDRITGSTRLLKVREALERDGSPASENAERLLRFLTALTANERSIVIGALFRLTNMCPNGQPVPGNTLAVDDDERRAITLAERDAVIPALVALGHLECRHSSHADVADAVLRSLATIADEHHRAIVLGDLLHAVAESAAARVEQEIERRTRFTSLLQRMGAGGDGVQLIELDTLREQSGD